MKHSPGFIKKTLTAAMILFMAAVSIIPQASAINKVVGKVRVILTDQGEIRPVDGTAYLLIQSKENKLWGVYNTSGERLSDDVMQNPTYVAYTCFSDQRPEPPKPTPSKKEQKKNKKATPAPILAHTINKKALFAIQGSYISDYEYGAIKAYNQHWAVGWVLSDATEDAYDYSPDKKNFYNIERCDVFSLTGSARLVARLDRDQFKTASAHGQYISIADREDYVSVYDVDFNLTKVKAKNVNEGIYNIVDFAVADRVKNEMILDGFTACKEITTSDGLLLQITRTYLDGSKKSGIITLDGEWLLPLTSDTIKTVTTKYAVMANAENQLGLYSFSQQRMIVPYKYNKFLTSNKQLDQYNYYGYAIAVDGDTRYYINLETGETERELVYGKKMSTLGGTVYLRESRLRMLFTAANGKQWRMKDMRVISSRGDGRLIVAKTLKNNSYGIYNMNGDIALEFKNKNQPLITDDGKVVLPSNKKGYQLLEIDW